MATPDPQDIREVTWSIGGLLTEAPLNVPSQRWKVPYALTVFSVLLTVGVQGVSNNTALDLFDDYGAPRDGYADGVRGHYELWSGAWIYEATAPSAGGYISDESSTPNFEFSGSTSLWVVARKLSVGAQNLALTVRYTRGTSFSPNG